MILMSFYRSMKVMQNDFHTISYKIAIYKSEILHNFARTAKNKNMEILRKLIFNVK